mgnify:CR=1 FL=1
MSGQPVNTALDQRKFRDSYMANLRLRAEIDDRNFQANKVFHRTGQTPTEMTDYRTTTEKMSDVYKLKLDVQSELLKLTDVTEALAIVNQLDGGQLQFLAQNIDPISKDIASRFKYGVTEAIFIPFFLRYQEKFENNLGVEQGLSQESGNAMMASIGLIQANMATTEDLIDLEELVEMTGLDTRGLRAGMDEVQDVVDMIPAMREQLDRIQRDGGNAMEIADLTDTLNRLVQDIPSRDQIDMAESRLTDAVKQGNQQGLNETMSFLDELFSLEADTSEQVRLISDQIKEASRAPTAPVVGTPMKEGGREAEEILPTAEAVYAGEVEGIDPSKGMSQSGADAKEGPRMYKHNYKTPELINWVNGAIQILKDEGVDEDELNGGYVSVTVGKWGDGKESVKWIGENNDLLLRYINPMKMSKGVGTPAKMKGTGMRGRPKKVAGNHPHRRYMTGSGMPRKEHRSDVIKIADIDFSKGVLPEKRFIPFGRYVINQSQLGKGIVAVKRPCGATIKDFPSERVSKKVHSIVNDIVGGKMPNFTTYDGLDDEEKSYLHRLTEVSNIENRLKIPAPNKDTEEQEINRFEILRGEITAGNDNPKMVKEFKLLIMKLGRKKLLPSNQVKEMIFELTSLGY